jgi:hypothetical protein
MKTLNNVISDEENNYYVYIHFDLINNQPFYVGKGKNKRAYIFSRRNKLWKKYFDEIEGNIEVIILFNNLNEEQALYKEKETEDILKVLGFKLTNICLTGVKGSTGHKKSKEWKRNYSNFISKLNKNRILTEEHKNNISKALINSERPWVRDSRLGKKQSKETCDKKSNKLKGRIQSLEEKEKRAEVKRGVPHYKIRKKVIQYDLKGNFIKEWDSMREAEDFYNNGKKNSSISSCCRNVIKTAYNFIWKYK